jgi:hypothetical protein
LNSNGKATRKFRSFYLGAVVLLGFASANAFAQTYDWDDEVVGSPSPAGSFSESGGIYTVSAGGQFGGTSDALRFLHQPIYGNVEVIAKVTSFTNTSSGAAGGLMIRSSMDADAAQASIVLTPSNGVKFYSRTTAGGSNATASGSASGTPRWLRLVRNGSVLTAYEAADGATGSWTQVGSPATLTGLGNTIQVGLAVAACQVEIRALAIHVNLPQASDSDLKLWLRADAGVNTSVPQVWTDQSASGFHADQSTSGNRPVWTDNILNGRPILRFDGSNDELSVAHNTAFNTSSVSMLTVFKRSGTSSGVIAGKMNSGGNQGYRQQYTSSTNLRSFINGDQANGTPGTSTFVLGETIYNQTNHKLYLDGTQASSTSYTTAVTSNTENFYIGSKNASSYFNGDIAEVIVYNRALADADRTDLRAYLYSKYAIAAWAPAQSTPVVTPTTGTFGQAQEVTISIPLGSRVYYSLDGGTPTQNSTLYTGPVTISNPSTLKARAFRVGYAPSAVATATYTFDPTVAALPRTNMRFWLRADSIGSSPVAAWEDQSGYGNNVAQATSGSRPTLTTAANGINSIPVVHFDGSDDFLQGDLPAANAMQSAHHSIIALYKTATTSNKKRILSLPYGTGSWNAPYASWALLAIGSSTYAGKAVSEIAYNTTTQSFAGATAASSTGTAYLAAASFSGSAHKFYESGLLKENTSVSGSIAYGAATVFNVGSRGIYNNGEYFQGDLAELFFFNEALTRAEQNKVEIYLAKKYALTIDSDQDGMDDVYEDDYGLDPLTNDASADPDGDSLTNLYEYQHGKTDPFDYYNGTAPTLEIVQGDNQTGQPDAFAAQTLRLKVKNGSTALVNAPVTFTVAGGSTRLAYANTGSPTFYSTVTLRTDSNGIAVKDSGGTTRDLYVKLPASPGDLDVQVTVDGYSVTENFDLTAVNPDADHDGVVDGDETTLGTDPNNADSDEDGVNDGDEVAENTDPLDFNDFTPKRLAYFNFNAANWSGDRGQLPYSVNGVSQVASWSGNALHIDQAGGKYIKFKRIDTDGKPNVTAQRGSVRLWFKPDWDSSTGSGYFSRLFQMGVWTGDASQGLWYLWLNSNGQFVNFDVADGNSHGAHIQSSINWAAQQWHQIVATYSSAGRKIYVDGTLATQSTTAWNYLIDKADLDSSGLMFGSDGSQPMKGDLDEVEIFNYELSATEIENDYEAKIIQNLDGDQLPDFWESEQLGTLAYGDSSDPDGDGVGNYIEYLQGRNPAKGTVSPAAGTVDLVVFTELEN